MEAQMAWRDVPTNMYGWPVDTNKQPLLSPEEQSTLCNIVLEILEKHRTHGFHSMPLHTVFEYSKQYPNNPLKGWHLFDYIYAALDRALRAVGAQEVYALSTIDSKTCLKQTLGSTPLNPEDVKITPAQKAVLKDLINNPLGILYSTINKKVLNTLLEKGLIELRRLDDSYKVNAYATLKAIQHCTED